VKSADFTQHIAPPGVYDGGIFLRHFLFFHARIAKGRTDDAPNAEISMADFIRDNCRDRRHVVRRLAIARGR
jgi:hypothetical protein